MPPIQGLSNQASCSVLLITIHIIPLEAFKLTSPEHLCHSRSLGPRLRDAKRKGPTCLCPARRQHLMVTLDRILRLPQVDQGSAIQDTSSPLMKNQQKWVEKGPEETQDGVPVLEFQVLEKQVPD